MTVTINASTSSGLITTADTSGVLALQTAGTTALTIDASQNVSFAGAQSINTTMATTTTYQTDMTLQAQPASGTTGTSSAGGVQLLFKGTTDGSIANSTLAAVVGFAQTSAANNAGGIAIRCQESSGSGLVDSARFASTGLISLRGATNVTSGSGIAFPATQSASSDANTLDDYEQGTWTPGVAAASVTYTARSGTYTKIGNVVYITGFVQIASITSPTGGAGATFMSGLPFACVDAGTAYYPQLVTAWNGCNFGGSVGVAQLNPSSTLLSALGCTNNSGFADASPADIWDSAGNWVKVTGFYYTT